MAKAGSEAREAASTSAGEAIHRMASLPWVPDTSPVGRASERPVEARMRRDGRETGLDRAYRRAAMRDVGRGQMEGTDPHRGPAHVVVASAASSADALVEEPLHAASAASKIPLVAAPGRG